ncbi:YoaK family protein [Pseudomonas sp. RIT-To-2]|uniref:YoaK family protein n=1 Tax=Pseudomonas sp. RIT-To-2 TaxID=3462541 RepID=UPI002413C6C2
MRALHPTVAPALSFNGGFVDTVGFLALQGLFTAHVTGNFVTLGVSIVHGTSGALAKLLALPVFILVVGLAHLAAVALNQRNLASLHVLMVAHTLLLGVFMGCAVWLGPFNDGDSVAALATGMVGVAAMAIQNALSRQHLKAAPPTTLMTGNVTQAAIDIFSLMSLRDTRERAVVRERLGPIGRNLLGFTLGCIGSALLYLAVGLWCLVVPVAVAAWTCVMTYEGRGELAQQ